MARNYTAQTLMLANASLGPVTQYDVITVSAMEGVGVAAAMEKQQQTSGVHTSSEQACTAHAFAPPQAVRLGCASHACSLKCQSLMSSVSSHQNLAYFMLQGTLELMIASALSYLQVATLSGNA